MKKTLAFVLVTAMILCMAPVFGIFADAGVVEIDTAEEFAAIKDNLGGSYKLTADITITEAISYKDEQALFTGTLDGNGKTITVDLTDNSSQRFGIFCSVEGCTIKNLTIKGNVYSNENSTGALIGTVKTTGKTVTLENVVNMANVTGGGASGGLIGVVEDDAIVNLIGCKNTGEVVGTSQFGDYRGAGGFIGKVNNRGATVLLKNCTNEGNVTAKYIVANAYIAHNLPTNYTVEGCTNTGVITSGGYVLPNEIATARDQGIWGSARFNYNADECKLSGSPTFHDTPPVTGYTAYICGVEATDKVTVTDKGDRRVEIIADCTGLADGYASVTIVWENGKYSTFGTGAPAKADVEQVLSSAELIGKLTEATVDTGSVSAENTLLANGWENDPKPHGSEGNLFDADAGNKYEGWHVMGSGSVVVKFQITEAAKITHYALGTGNDDANYPDRQPAEWKLWASVDGNEYVLLDHVQGDNLPNLNNKLVAFKSDSSDVAYKFFKLEILSFISEEGKADGQGSYVQLGQIKVYTCEHTWGDPVVEGATCTEDGSSTKTCTNCGAVETEVIESDGHNYVDGTCTVCGGTDGSGNQGSGNEGENTPDGGAGDATTVAVMLAVIALAGVAIVSKKRSAC